MARVSRRRRIVSATLLGLILLAALDGFAIEPYALDVQTHAVTGQGLKAPLTLVHLSDLHTSGFGRRERRVVELVKAVRPDLIVVTGDVVDTGSLEPARELFQGLRAPLGVFVVRGNWENWKPPAGGSDFYASVGAQLLVNEGRLVRPDVWLAGVDDPMSGSADMDAARRGAPAGAQQILLVHSPELFDSVTDESLVFAGHTHGGQVRLPFVRPLWTPPGSGRFVEGWYQSGKARMLVSRGVGTSVLPVRFFCHPEIARVDVAPP